MIRRIIKYTLIALVIACTAIYIWGYAADIPVETLKSKYANAQSEFINLDNGLTVHLRDEGPRDAPAIILLHGSNASLHIWDSWVNRLKDEYRIIRYDQAGHGLTGPHPRDCYSHECFNDIVDRVAQNRGLDHFILGGNSMGGGIAYSYARAHPEKLDGLILADAAGAPDATPKKIPIGFRIMGWPIVNRLATVITPRTVIEKSLYGSVSKNGFINDAEIDRYWELFRRPGNRDATVKRFNQYRSYPKNTWDDGPINTPTIIIWGNEDKLIPVGSVPWFEKMLPNHESHIYKGVGHLPMREIADESGTDVENWLLNIMPLSTPQN